MLAINGSINLPNPFVTAGNVVIKEENVPCILITFKEDEYVSIACF